MKLKNKTIYISLTLVVIAFIVIIQFKLSNISKEEMMQKKYGLNNLSVEEMVTKLDKGKEDNKINAKITANELILEYQNEEFKYSVNKDMFYISFAPYINNTHSCSIHNLVTCNSELKNILFDVKIYTDDNEVLFDNKIKSYDNGFVGIWIKRNIEATIEVKYNDYTLKQNISTFDNSNTCLTTPMQLN